MPTDRWPPLHCSIWFSIYGLFVLFSVGSSLCLKGSKMENCLNLSSSSSTNLSLKNNRSLPISTIFSLPSPIPKWPPGEGFASGIIDLGGLQVSQISTFTQIWATHEGGPDNLGATFYEPSSIPQGFFMLGSYSQPNNKPLFGWVLVAKDTTNDSPNGSLKMPLDYTLIWSSESSNIKQDSKGYIWLPTPPKGYKAAGHMVTNSLKKPSGEKFRCVRTDLTDLIEVDTWIWGLGEEVNSSGLNIYSSRPTIRGTQALGVPVGSFLTKYGGVAMSLACLKNVKANLSTMPNVQQIQALVQAYSPSIYLHPDEEYLPSSVNWFFQNGALLHKGQDNTPVRIEPNGSNLPQGSSNDGAYWLDLPIDEKAKEMVKKGYLDTAKAYLHIKPTLGATFTDIAMWIFYPFNGPARVKVMIINIPLEKIGQHVGDWEHVTLRVSNFNGKLKAIFFSQHSGGIWVDASELEFQNGNKPVTYASLHGHAFYPKPGLILQGGDTIGIRNDAAKSKMVMDTGTRFTVVAAEYLPPSIVVEPPWLNFTRKWGPNINYDIDEEIEKVEKLLPGKLKSKFMNFVRSIPKEILGEEGPTGPKVKNNWIRDELP
ncbi:hypothetical protein LguiA_010603 [Lonicera macranthoides]